MYYFILVSPGLHSATLLSRVVQTSVTLPFASALLAKSWKCSLLGQAVFRAQECSRKPFTLRRAYMTPGLIILDERLSWLDGCLLVVILGVVTLQVSPSLYRVLAGVSLVRGSLPNVVQGLGPCWVPCPSLTKARMASPNRKGRAARGLQWIRMK